MKRIGDILTRNKTRVILKETTLYKQITVRLNYKGVVLRGTQYGAAIGTKDQFIVSAGQFLLSKIDARNGAFGLIPEELDGAIVTNSFLAFDINEKEVEPDFFNVLLQSPTFLDACIKASKGTTNRKPVDEDFFLNYEVNLPPLSKQHYLIKRINKARAGIQTAQNEIKHQQLLLAKLKQAILQEAVQGKLTADWRAANPGLETASPLLQRIKAEKVRLLAAKKLRSEKPLPKVTSTEILFEIPKGWEWCRTADIGIVIGGLTKNSAKRGGHKRVLPYLRVANVYANHLNLTDLQEIGVTESEVKKLLLEKDDLLVVEGNGSRDQVGRIALWDGSVDPCVHQNHVIKVRLGDTKVAPWVLHWFLSPNGRTLIEEQARTSTGLYNLSTGKVASLPVPFPPLAEQKAIVERVASLMSTCRALEAKIEHTRTHADNLIQAVLREAFSDEASVQPSLVKVIDLSSYRSVVGCYAIQKMQGKNYFGRTAAMKVFYLAQAHVGVPLELQPLREAAGPFDKWIYSFEEQGQQESWFRVIETSTSDGKKKIEYKAETAITQKSQLLEEVISSDQHKELDRLLRLLADKNTQEVEIIATLFAAWNDFLIDGKSPSDDQIISEVRENWHASKARFTHVELSKWLSWMRLNKLTPKGRPPRTSYQSKLI